MIQRTDDRYEAMRKSRSLLRINEPAVETAASFTLINRLFAIGVRSPAIVTPSNLFAERTDDVRSPKARLTLKALKTSTRQITDNRKTPALVISTVADEGSRRRGRTDCRLFWPFLAIRVQSCCCCCWSSQQEVDMLDS